MRVVVGDDDADMRLLLRLALEIDGRFEVVGEAGDGCGVIHLCEYHRPDAVLIDREMPVLGADGALPFLRQRCPETAVIVVSGSLQQGATHALYDAGAAAVLAKPVIPQHVVECLASVVTARTN